MSRLIDADALLEALADKFVSVNGNIIDLINNAPTVQREGWVSVPIEPTGGMVVIGSNAAIGNNPFDIARSAYKAMISAAPKE
jgi:hypothetical protein